MIHIVYVLAVMEAISCGFNNVHEWLPSSLVASKVVTFFYEALLCDVKDCTINKC